MAEIIPQTVTLEIGEEVNWDELKVWLEFRGYARVQTVSATGHYAEVGSTIVIWPSAYVEPIILDRFDEVLERAKAGRHWIVGGDISIPPFKQKQLNEKPPGQVKTKSSQPSFFGKLLRNLFGPSETEKIAKPEPTIQAPTKPKQKAKSTKVEAPPPAMDWDGLYFPKHWVKRSGETIKSGQQIEAWGWGETEKQAAAVAEYRLAAGIKKSDADITDWDAYGYGLGGMPLREKMLDAIAKDNSGKLTAALTLNRYGALILSTRDMMMIDIDLPSDSADEDKIDFIQQAKVKLEAEKGRSFLLFETFGGLRAICTSHVDKADDPTTLELMKRVGADPLYVRLCKEQKCFRSRLTPKPWRLDPPIKPPIDEPSDEWIAKYESRSAGYGVCRQIGWVGAEEVLPEFFEQLDIHNQSVAKSEKQLA